MMSHERGRGRGGGVSESLCRLTAEKRGLERLMEREGYDLSKFELVAVPEAFCDESATDELGHGGLLEYDGFLDVESYNDDDDPLRMQLGGIEPGEGFDVTIEHVDNDLASGPSHIQLMDINDHTSMHQFHPGDILDVGIEAHDLNSLLEQFEECEQPKKGAKQKPEVQKVEQAKPATPKTPKTVKPTPQKTPVVEKAFVRKELPNPEDIIKKIAPVKRKGAILLESDFLPQKKIKPRQPAIQTVDVNKTIKTTQASSVPQNIQTSQASPARQTMNVNKALPISRASPVPPISRASPVPPISRASPVPPISRASPVPPQIVDVSKGLHNFRAVPGPQNMDVNKALQKFRPVPVPQNMDANKALKISRSSPSPLDANKALQKSRASPGPPISRASPIPQIVDVNKALQISRASPVPLTMDVNKALQASRASPVPQIVDVNKAIQISRTSPAGSPIPFNLKALLPPPKYLSMEHDYCRSPALSDKSNSSDLGTHMSQEQRRAYYKYKYKVKKKDPSAFDSPSQSSSVSSSPASMSPASRSPEVGEGEEQENIDVDESAKAPPVNVPAQQEPTLPLFDKIPNYFPGKLLMGMYREINPAAPPQPVKEKYKCKVFRIDNNDPIQEGYSSKVYPIDNNNDEAMVGKTGGHMDHRHSRSRSRRRRNSHRSYRKPRSKRNSLSSQSPSSDSGSQSDITDRRDNVENRSPSCHRGRSQMRRGPRRTRQSVCSTGSRSPSRSCSRSGSCSSYSSYDSRAHSGSRQCSFSRSPSYSRSPSNSRSRSRSYSRSRSRSFSRSPSYSRSRSRSYSRSPSRDFARRSRSYSRSLSRSPVRSQRSHTRASFSRTPQRSRSRTTHARTTRSRTHGGSRARSMSRHHADKSSSNRTFDPNAGSEEVIYTAEQLQEFAERRTMYVGNITRETTKDALLRQFSRFGRIDKVSLHFRENQDSYGFVTFQYRCDAVAAIASADDPNWPKYDLCFGGRRKFCKSKYEDLDSLNKASSELEFGYHGDNPAPRAEESEFDKLLKAAMKGKRR